MSDECVPGLREQKRRATRRALQIAMLQHALDRGFEHVTIEEVCRAAQVSPRTFFNYFASKEDAVAGPSAPFAIADDDVAWFIEGRADVLTDLVTLVARNVDQQDDIEVHRLRKALLERHPHLVGVKLAEAQRFHQRAVELASRRLRADAERAGETVSDDRIADRAGLIVLLVVSIARHAWSRWAGEGGSAALGESVREAFAQFRDVAAPVVAASALLDA